MKWSIGCFCDTKTGYLASLFTSFTIWVEIEFSHRGYDEDIWDDTYDMLWAPWNKFIYLFMWLLYASMKEIMSLP